MMSVKLIAIWCLLCCNYLLSASTSDSLKKVTQITKTLYAGSTLEVPKHKTWLVKRVLVNSGSYNMACCNNLVNKCYESGQKLSADLFNPETALLTKDTNSIYYVFEIEETTLP